jgi:DNA modification methylase
MKLITNNIISPISIVEQSFREFERQNDLTPLFLAGDSLEVLKGLPSASIDFCMTSPPYWAKREYEAGGIGLEATWQAFIAKLIEVFAEVQRVLKPTGSCWVNLGDSYLDKNLLGIPWRFAFEMTDKQGWILRNSVVWNKVKSGMDTSNDRLGNIHEMLFHFVKNPQYYYDVDSIRSSPGKTKVQNGSIVSATGVSGVRYKRQIQLSNDLNETEKKAAFDALEKMLQSLSSGEIADFRMIIRGQQRTTHSDSSKLSGRGKEVAQKGFCFLRYHPKGSKPADVWDILPEDSQKRKHHFAPYPVDLCRTPILATCPPNGIVLDPFCGTGTTNLAAQILGRRSIGIDMSKNYLREARERCHFLL